MKQIVQNFTKGQTAWAVVFIFSTLLATCMSLLLFSSSLVTNMVSTAQNVEIPGPSVSDGVIPITFITSLVSAVGLIITTGLSWRKQFREELKHEKLDELDQTQKAHNLEVEKIRLKFELERQKLELEKQKLDLERQRLEIEKQKLELAQLQRTLQKNSTPAKPEPTL